MPLNNPITSALLADPEIFQQNRLPFHAHFADQTSPEMPLTVSLDGEWNFRYAENLTAPFTDWDTLTVPGFIQMQSLQKPGQPYGTPHYVNTQYPWDGHEKLRPGEIPQDYNPIGEYQRSFTLPESWASCYLRLNGADSAAAVWCNGVYIGYTEDTFTPAEFDMTAAVHPGENTLTVQVYRFSSGSWLEDQDFWRMSGLFRSVELFTKPELHLEDVFVKQDFAPDFSSATVTFDCKVSGAGTVSVVFNGQEQSAEVGEPAEYDSGVVFGKGEADPEGFMAGIAEMTRGLIANYSQISEDAQKLFQTERVVIGKCPRCGESVYEGKKNYYCGNRSCQFVMWKNDRFFEERGKAFTPKIAAALLKDGKAKVKGLRSMKTGKTYDGTVLLADTGGKYVNYRVEQRGKNERQQA